MQSEMGFEESLAYSSMYGAAHVSILTHILDQLKDRRFDFMILLCMTMSLEWIIYHTHSLNIVKIRPYFNPSSVLDFGCGPSVGSFSSLTSFPSTINHLTVLRNSCIL